MKKTKKQKDFIKKDFLFFEGSEKKLEIVVQSQDLRLLGKPFWEKIISLSKSSILSHIQNASCDAYLLSESSLFIWKDRFTMITCGKTTLIESALFFLNRIKKKHLKLLIYERKNEFFPLHQSSDFYQDIKKLKKKLKGQAFLLGENAGHHLLLFHTENKYSPPIEDNTFEILMYNFKKEVKNVFNPPQWNKKKIQKLTHLDKIFLGFKKDEHFFYPAGYSLNAIKEEKYYTIHITKETLNNIYISFETNAFVKDQEVQIFLKKFLAHFKPLSFDLILLKPFKTAPRVSNSFKKELQKSKEKWKGLQFKFQNYQTAFSGYHFLEASYKIHFSHFFYKLKKAHPAQSIQI